MNDRHVKRHIPVKNLFSVGLCAPLMNEALLCTSLLPLQTRLQVEQTSLVTCSESIRTTQVHLDTSYISILYKNTEMSSWLMFCFPWETGRRSGAGAEVGFSTSDDVDSSQTIESTNQLSVSFFTLHSTFLLQGLQELLHCHGAGERTRKPTQHPFKEITESTLNKLHHL